MFFISMFLALTCGIFLSLQSPTNAALARRTDSLQAAAISFGTSTILLLPAALLFGSGSLGAVIQADWWMLFGGIYGGLFVLIITTAVPVLGTALTLTCSMLGQILMGILIDVLGLLCVTPIPLNLPRIGGCILVIVGIILVYRASNQNDLQGRHFRSISSARKIRLALLALAAGMGSAIQAPTNTALAGITGNIEASFFSFLGGVIFFAVILILRRLGFARRTAAGNSTAGYSEMDTASETQTPKRRIRPWMLTGGVYGASVVLFTIIATPNLGVALVLGLSMIGQLAGGLTVDTLGLLQAKRFPLVPRRLIGILLVTAGVILIAIGRISAL